MSLKPPVLKLIETEETTTQGDLTQIFPTFSNPILNLRSKNIFYKTNIKDGQKVP